VLNGGGEGGGGGGAGRGCRKECAFISIFISISDHIRSYSKVKVKQSCYGLGVAQRVSGS
jgi:hypothetical protein